MSSATASPLAMVPDLPLRKNRQHRFVLFHGKRPVMTADPTAPELILGFDDPSHLARVVVRLAAAMILGGVLGLEREKEHKAAGLRTHMLVSLGSALFVVVPLEAGATVEHVTRIIQGLVV